MTTVPESTTVRPDAVTKLVSSIGYAIILAVLLWVGSSTADLRDRVSRIEEKLSERSIRVDQRLEQLERSLDLLREKISASPAPGR